MKEYICIRCNKKFSSKTDHTRHSNRKLPCDKSNNNSYNVLEDINDLRVKLEQITKENELLKTEVATLKKATKITNNNTINNTNNNSKTTGLGLEISFEDLENKTEENPNELSEFNIDIDLENNLESIQLKKPNQVYFELYKEARNKAKLAKRNAILAYLEAKNIKKTYMLENINNSDTDSDFDDEIDEVSESELEGL